MTILEDSAEQIISEFGETVTVHPTGDYEPEDDTNPIYFNESSSTPTSFDLRVRFFSHPSDETVKQYGLEQDVEAMMYSVEGSVEEGDEIEYGGSTFVVTDYYTKQIGNGPYRWVYNLQRVE